MKNTLEPMPDGIKKDFVNLLSVQSHSNNEKRMILYLTNWLCDNKLYETEPDTEGWYIDEVGNLVVTKGVAGTYNYPCIVAHLDTVHKVVKKYTIWSSFRNNEKILYAKQGRDKLAKNTGIGGDDKCGIFACLYFLKVLDNVKVVFFTQEESGCKGSRNIDHAFFEN